MKRTILITTILLLFCGICFPQNLGYMGNHFIINADVSLSPSWKNPNPLSQALNAHYDSEHTRNYLGLNYFLSPNIEAIVWNKGTVGAGYNYYNTPIGGTISRYFEKNRYIIEDYNFTGKLTAHGFNVFYKQYLGDTRAPMGYYLKFTLDGYFYKYACNEKLPTWTQYYETHPDPTGNFVPVLKDGKGSIFGMKAELGYDYLFFNRLRLSMGFTVGSTFGGYNWLNLKSKISLYDNESTANLNVNNYVRYRILGAYWFGIKVGVGILAF